MIRDKHEQIFSSTSISENSGPSMEGWETLINPAWKCDSSLLSLAKVKMCASCTFETSEFSVPAFTENQLPAELYGNAKLEAHSLKDPTAYLEKQNTYTEEKY